jgi:hypothetical protein
MAQMERLYTVDLAVAEDDGNDGGGGRGGKAGAPGSNGIACVNCQVVAAAAAAVEEEEKEGAVDHNGNCVANGDGGPVAHSDCKDGNKSAAPRTGRMTMRTAATAMGGDCDRPAKGKFDHCNNGVSDCYQSGGGGKTWDGSGGSDGGRGGGNSNRKNGGGCQRPLGIPGKERRRRTIKCSVVCK